MGNTEFELKNVAEELIEPHLDECMETLDMCMCPRCRADVMASSLNEFGSRYVVSEMGDILARAMALSNQYRADIISVIIKCALLVKEKPRHGDYKPKL